MQQIVTRAEWGARPPRSRRTIEVPTAELWLHHSGANEPDGPAGVRQIQNFHMDRRRWVDIAYSYVVDRTGRVFEGRGAGVAGAHTSGHNTISHAICVIGNYESSPVPQPVLDVLPRLVRHGAQQGWWPGAITGGHRQASGATTTCPGRNLLDAIDTINRRAQAGEEFTVQPIWYAERGTPDHALAAWASQAIPGGNGSVSCDLDQVRRAARSGAQVIAVGGPAARALHGVPHTAAVGTDARGTGQAVVDML